ncbi:unnamed protein product [Linum tenue]|uniref:F-box domain-containing protein n=1 Tax=Linum tenue TaxID=586396 RepID=A0AAV0JJX7_9ROSI|nr:unnamed protein product [Linum tenue]
MKRERPKDRSGELAFKPKKPQTAPSVDEELLFPFLPEHIVTEILVRLPPKSLLRFRCLSHHHSNLIQSPNFVAAHAGHAHRNRTGLLVYANSQSGKDVVSFIPSKLEGSGGTINGLVSAFPLPFLKKKGYGVGKSTSFQCAGSFNGLVCFILDTRGYWVLWNPATDQFCFDVSQPEKNLPRNHTIAGFGYDSAASEYKSVRVSCNHGGGAQVEVLNWAERHWTEIQDESFHAIFTATEYREPHFHKPPVTTNNGRVHWMESSSGMVLSFKPHDEKFEWVSTPEASLPWSIQRSICAWKGSLAMLVQHEIQQDSLLSLWLYNDGGGGELSSSSWSTLFTISTMGPPCMPEAIWRVDAQSSFLLYINGSACNYNNGKRLKLPYVCIYRAFEFAQTLVPIPGCS